MRVARDGGVVAIEVARRRIPAGRFLLAFGLLAYWTYHGIRFALDADDDLWLFLGLWLPLGGFLTWLAFLGVAGERLVLDAEHLHFERRLWRVRGRRSFERRAILDVQAGRDPVYDHDASGHAARPGGRVAALALGYDDPRFGPRTVRLLDCGDHAAEVVAEILRAEGVGADPRRWTHRLE